MSGFQVYPAIDVRGGHVVRLRQGDYACETRYGDDPFAVAQRYARAGASWLHLVDLDGAREGRYTLLSLLGRLRDALGLQVQTGGGVRDGDAIAQLLDAGAARVVVGSVAVRKPGDVEQWLGDHGGDAITVALDTRQDARGAWCLPVQGWTQDSGVALTALLGRYSSAGLRHLLCTDIARDGMLSGPNLGLYRMLHERVPGIAIQASGGVRALSDLRDARQAGCAGVVLGKALLEGNIDLREALAC